MLIQILVSNIWCKIYRDRVYDQIYFEYTFQFIDRYGDFFWPARSQDFNIFCEFLMDRD